MFDLSESYKAPCPHHRQCGGCQLQNLPYAQQLEHKQREAVKILGSFGHVENIIGMDNPLHYRNKVHAAFGLDRRRKVISGIYQPGSHAIVPVDECMIEDETADRIIRSIRKMLPEFRIQVYDELAAPCAGEAGLCHRRADGGAGGGKPHIQAAKALS